MDTVVIFCATFLLVFGMGFQALNVTKGHIKAAFVTSFLLGLANLALLKMVPSTESMLDIAAFLCGGPFGVIASMKLHSMFMEGKG